MPDSDSRLAPSEQTKISVWAAAAGRCTFCNRSVLENEDLGELVPIGELAHNIGWGENSPRGKSPLDREQRRKAENIILLCRNCHKPVDNATVARRYSVDELTRRKQEHEQRIRFLTEIDASREAAIVRLVGSVRGVNPELTYETVLGATTAAGLYPKLLPGCNSAEHELDLRQISDSSPHYVSTCTTIIDTFISRIDDGIRRHDITRLAVFGFARIPLLIYFGAKLDDKAPTRIFQRQRVDHVNAWRWPESPPAPPEFQLTKVRGNDTQRVAFIVNLSGTIQLEDLPTGMADTHSVYCLTPVAPDAPSPTLISSPEALTNFDRAARHFLASVEANHGKLGHISLFAAIPVSAAITIGRILMPHVSPAWRVFDRDSGGQFVEVMEVRR